MHFVLCANQLGGMVATSSLAEVSIEALKAMLSGEEPGMNELLEAWLTLARHKVRERRSVA